MKLWEAMRLLEEDPSRKFEHQDDQKKWLLYADAGCYDDRVFYMLDCWDNKGELKTGHRFGSLHGNLSTADNWQPVKQPATWQEAILEFSKGNKVVVKFNCQEWTLEALIELPEYLNRAITIGKWYVGGLND